MEKYLYPILLGILGALLFSSCTKYQGTSTKLMDDLGVNYEIVDELPYNSRGDALYDSHNDKIYVKKGKEQVYLILHELVHKIRVNEGVFLGWDRQSHRLEEAIAVYAAIEIGKRAGLRLGVGKYVIPSLLSRTLKANGLERQRLSEAEKKIVDKEVENTVYLFIERLEERGLNLKEVDWVRTAILILI